MNAIKTIDPVATFLSEKSGTRMLKKMLAMKEWRKRKLQREIKEFLKSDAFSELDEIRSYFLEKVADLKYGSEREEIKRDLRNMQFILRKTKKSKLPTNHNQEWEWKYENATQRVKIDQVVSSLLGIHNPKRMIRCCFHKDKTPSLKLYENSNRFVCFGCGTKGSPIDFVMQYKNCDFREAVEFLYAF